MKLYEIETLIFEELKESLKKDSLYFWDDKEESLVHTIEAEKILWTFTVFYSKKNIELEFYGTDELGEESKVFAEFRHAIKLILERKLKSYFL
jgi:hypothetical protein